ncbi:MAG: TonB-dependent siderophore receptor [Janthinobacterium lividum]
MTGQRRDPVVAGGALGSRRDLDTPFSTRTVTAAEIQDRQVKSLARVFSEDASFVPNGNTYSYNSYSVTVRGVPLDDFNGYKINGAPFYMTTVELPLESFEQVQLLKGASGFLYGFNAPGGLIDYETKKPTDRSFVAADVGYSSGSVVSQHIDLGGRVARSVLGYRVNLEHEQGRTYNGSNVRRYSGSIGLDARIAPSLLWTADAIYQDRRVYGGIQGVILNQNGMNYAGSQLPAPVSGDTNLSAVPSTFFNSEVLYLASGLRWDLNDHWTARVNYSHSYDWRRYGGEWPRLENESGDFQDFLTASQGVAVYDQVQALVEGHFVTGPFHHQLTFGGSWQGLTRLTARNSMNQPIGSTENLYQPLTTILIPHDFSFPQYRSLRSDQTSAFASDTIDFGRKWSLIAGVRFTDYRQINYSAAGGPAAVDTETPLTPVAALLFHPWRDTTLYVSYVQALEDGGTVGDSYANAEQSLSPIRSDQIEVGAKIDRPGWSASAALYRINRGAQYADAANVFVSNGNERLQGLEANNRINLPWGFVFTNSFGWEEAVYQQTETDLIGNRVEGVPRFQDSVQLTNHVPWVKNLSATAEARYVDSIVGDSPNTFNLPHYVLVNLRASYTTKLYGKTVTLRAEVDNVANKHFWGFQASDYIYVGEPRTAYLNARIQF